MFGIIYADVRVVRAAHPYDSRGRLGTCFQAVLVCSNCGDRICKRTVTLADAAAAQWSFSLRYHL